MDRMATDGPWARMASAAFDDQAMMANLKATRPEGSLTNFAAAFDEALGYLDKSINMLTNRLAGLLPDAETSGRASGPPVATFGTSPMMRQLGTYHAQLRLLTERIDLITANLEV